jgi:hypothetical protein
MQYFSTVDLLMRNTTKFYFTIFGAKMSKLWILETLLTIFEKPFSKNPFNISR